METDLEYEVLPTLRLSCTRHTQRRLREQATQYNITAKKGKLEPNPYTNATGQRGQNLKDRPMYVKIFKIGNIVIDCEIQVNYRVFFSETHSSLALVSTRYSRIYLE